MPGCELSDDTLHGFLRLPAPASPDGLELDSGAFAQAEEEKFLQLLHIGQPAEFLDGRVAALDLHSVVGRRSGVFPAALPVKRMRAWAEPYVRLAPPVFAIVAGLESGPREIRDFLLRRTFPRAKSAGVLVGGGHNILPREGQTSVAGPGP